MSQSTIPRVGTAMEMTVLRITQEALLNIARHSQANHVMLSLQCEADAMLLAIEDNGVGIQMMKEPNLLDSHGLMIMRERAEAVGGTLKVVSAPTKGTRIEATLPLQHEDKTRTGHEEHI